MLILASALTNFAVAETLDANEPFLLESYAGVSVRFDAPQETVPSENIRIDIQIHCTAQNVNITHLRLNIYGFKFGKERILLDFKDVGAHALVFNETTLYNYTVQVPGNVWNAMYAELHIEYTVVDESFDRTPSFPITVVRNIYLEELEKMFENLNYTYWHLNQTFWEFFSMNLTQPSLISLNQTYHELKDNYTSIRGGSSDLENTQRTVIILAITTVFFVATTIYVIMRKPKQSW